MSGIIGFAAGMFLTMIMAEIDNHLRKKKWDEREAGYRAALIKASRERTRDIVDYELMLGEAWDNISYYRDKSYASRVNRDLKTYVEDGADA